jgi:flagellar hook-associated protein 1
MISSLSNILNIATSGLQAAQAGLSAVSNNVANVNTPGYVREVVNQTTFESGGAGVGVDLTGFSRTIDRYLESMNFTAQAGNGSASIENTYLDQAQSLFGDPTSSSSFFGQLDNIFSSFSTLASNPSSAGQTAAVSSVQQFLSQGQSIVSSLQTMSGQVDQNIESDVTTVNSLLSQIGALNTQISQATAGGGDATGAQNQQSQLINQLSSLMNVNVTANSTGGVTLSAADGSLLVSNQSAASLSYSPTPNSGQLLFTPVGGVQQPMGSRLNSGELSGLLDLRNNQLPTISSQVSNLMSGAANALNQVSNSYSSQPPPSTLTGRNTGMDLPTEISGFTGSTNVAVLNSSGTVQTNVAIDFDAGTMSVNGGAAVSFTPATFLSTLNSSLGTSGSASFNNGALSISASGSGNGVVVSDNSSDPSSKAGQNFSDFFGLNDLVTSTSPTDYNTGLTATSNSDYPPGQTISFALTGNDGSLLSNVTVTTPPGGTMQDMLNALNDRATGVGLYGSFSLDSNGQLSFTPNGGSGVSLAVTSDNTSNTATGMSMSQLFGIGAATRTAAQNTYQVNSSIAANPALLQSATINVSGGVGSSALTQTSNSAYGAFANANTVSTSFNAALGMAAQTGTLSNYASTISQAIAQRASVASDNATQASAVATEAQSRLSSAEGVNMDQEMISLTTYQQAYSASARLVQATQDMFTTLLGMTGT